MIAPYIDFDLMDSLQQKERFYQLCEKHGVDYPKTIIYRPDMGLDFPCEFSYPVIVKAIQQYCLLGTSVSDAE